MAPEQLECFPATRQTDIYAATVVLWEALTGERMLRMGQVGARAIRILTGNFPAPGTLNPAAGPELDSIVRKGLSRNPSDRFATAREMALALERAVIPASTSRVGEWVAETSAEALRQRDLLVTQIETMSDSSVRGSPSLTAEAIRAMVATEGHEPHESGIQSSVRDVRILDPSDPVINPGQSAVVALGRLLDDPFLSSEADNSSELDMLESSPSAQSNPGTPWKRVATLIATIGLVCLLGTVVGIGLGVSGTRKARLQSLGVVLGQTVTAFASVAHEDAEPTPVAASQSAETVSAPPPPELPTARPKPAARPSHTAREWTPRPIDPAPLGARPSPARNSEFGGLTRR